MAVSRPHARSRGGIVRALKMIAASKATWFSAAVWLASVLVLAVGGHDIPVAGIAVGVVLLLLSLLVTRITEQVPKMAVVAGPARRRLWVQFGLVVVFIALTGWSNLAFHDVWPAAVISDSGFD